MSWSGNGSHPEDPNDGDQYERRREEAEPRNISGVLGASRAKADLTLDVTGEAMPQALHPATLVRKKSLPSHRSHHKPLTASRFRAPQGLARVSEDAGRLLEDYFETGRSIQARRLTMSLTRALEADLGHWEWSAPERADCLQSLPGNLEHLQSLCQPLLTCLITAGVWAEGDFALCCTAPLEYLSNPVLTDPYGARKSIFSWLRHYPMLLLLHGAGIAAVAGGRYRTLYRLLHEVTMPEPFGTSRCPLIAGLFAWSGMEPEIARQLPGTPAQGSVTDHFYSVMEQPLRDVTGRPALYDVAFDRFTLLLTLAHADQVLSSGRPLDWVPQERMSGSVLAGGTATRLEDQSVPGAFASSRSPAGQPAR